MGAGTRRRRKQDRPAELLEAALALFVGKGFAATRMDEIAARAGVSKGTIYLYFPSKEDLLRALIARRLSSELNSAAQRVADHDRSCADLLCCLLDAWSTLLDDATAGGIVKLVFTEMRSLPQMLEFWTRELIEPSHRLIRQIVCKGIESGEFRTVNADMVVRSLVLPLIMGCLHRQTTGPCPALDRLLGEPGFFAQHVEFVLQALAPS